MKKIITLLLCCCIVLFFSGCGKSEGSGTQNSIANATNSKSSTITIKKFSDEAELKKYANKFWVYEEKSNDNAIFKLRFFTETTGFSWDFSFSSNETLEDCIKNVLKFGEEQGQSIRSATELLAMGLNVDGLESKNFDIIYDVNQCEVISKGQTYGTFLNDGTLKCDGNIYKTDSGSDFEKGFVMAKGRLFQEKYDGLVSYKDVKYDPYSYYWRDFLLTGTAELSDYYNYDYRDLESVYFCICVTPDGGGYSDRWYIYCYRDEYADLLEKLKSGSKRMMLICYGIYPDSLKEEMANLRDYCF